MVHIVLVEDDLDDVYFFKMACETLPQKPDITILNDGTKLIEYLETNNGANKIILLDLNMPKLGGFEVLKKLNELGKINQLLIVTYTTSDNEEDIEAAYQLGVKSYLTKPDNLEELSALVSTISEYWFKYNTTPN
ncbi:response regulator [Paraglaciecola sp. L3A3]|uniref:response regulator n=1 Tax=Paraglaciecola sp. L3A3 TaxID=2686358 RepID=UPI00131C19E6|nr:response regulator [Paraglaciecola sp. L3A3]